MSACRMADERRAKSFLNVNPSSSLKYCLQSLDNPVDIASRLVNHRDAHMAITLPISDAPAAKHDCVPNTEILVYQ